MLVCSSGLTDHSSSATMTRCSALAVPAPVWRASTCAHPNNSGINSGINAAPAQALILAGGDETTNAIRIWDVDTEQRIAEFLPPPGLDNVPLRQVLLSDAGVNFAGVGAREGVSEWLLVVLRCDAGSTPSSASIEVYRCKASAAAGDMRASPVAALL